MCKFEDITKNYNVGSMIGFGTYGDVYKVNHVVTNESYAMKISYINDNFINPIILREISNIIKYKHPNIIKL